MNGIVFDPGRGLLNRVDHGAETTKKCKEKGDKRASRPVEPFDVAACSGFTLLAAMAD
ncbi:MAG: hypothetical protein ACTSP2_00115 [Alphaproteobacteria bacterium]